MFNKVIMVGRLTRNVELKYLPSGSAAATIGLATSRRFKKQDGTLGEDGVLYRCAFVWANG